MKLWKKTNNNMIEHENAIVQINYGLWQLSSIE